MKKVLGLLLVGCFLFSLNSFAREDTFEWAGEFSYIKYEEPNVMKEDGLMYGISGNYYARDKGNMFGLEAKLSYGQVDYKNSGTMDNIDDLMGEIRVLIGRDIEKENGVRITPYFGFGYRYLNDDAKGTTSTGALGYERESNYWYSPLGVMVDKPLKESWSVCLVAEYDLFWQGTQKSHLSDANSAYNDLENDQSKGYGLRASAMFKKQGERSNFFFGPFVKYWNIKKSEEKAVTYSGVIFGYGYEPKNNSLEGGFRLGWEF